MLEPGPCPAPSAPIDAAEIEVSVVIPCLNESRTIAHCVRRARDTLAAADLAGEVIVADNGSTDGSQDLARAEGARVIPVAQRGYGHALMAGIARARGRFVIMGDADGSYDFGTIPQFVAKLREGAELVQGCRLPSGGGQIAEGAMPWLHRWIGNPALSWLAKLMFRTELHDVYCGLRGFTKEFYTRMNLRCTGMEFATEMIIKSAQHRARCSEVPITLHRDGRGGAASHLRTFRDGWRTLRLYLLCSPRWLYVFPSLGLLLFGLIAGLVGWLGVRLGPATFDVHTLLVAGLSALLGHQGLLFALFTSTYAAQVFQLPPHAFLRVFYRHFTLERGLLLSVGAVAAGLAMIAAVFFAWRSSGYGELNYPSTMRLIVPGVLLVALGTQTLFASFAISLIGIERR